MTNEFRKKLRDHIAFIYGEKSTKNISARISKQLARFQAAYPELASSSPGNRVSERDSILITYGDMIQRESQPPLQTLAAFLQKFLGDMVSTIHILPFYPYSSDDGFSVIDHHTVNPSLGDWDDVAHLGENFRLMFDAVINHISSQSVWFQGFLRGKAKYKDYFIEVGSDFDVSQVFRPRALPLVTTVNTTIGEKKVWTTFSPDQIDLNFSNPEVLLAVLDVILAYAAHGAEFIRLDAIAFIWKESGTNCVHRPETHRIVQLMRTALDIVAPGVSIITETNVPHEENISYFGSGNDEAQMVYNFSLPPLVLHAFHTGNTKTLTKWAAALFSPSEHTTFFNFLASHDGIGLMPARGILSHGEIAQIVDRVEALGGYVSYKKNSDGSKTAYELNINYLDALGDPQVPEEDTMTVAQRFLAAQSVMLTLRGVPGIYFHSLFGSRNWSEGVEMTGRYRSINREKLHRDHLERELVTPQSLPNLIYNGFRCMLTARKSNPAFHPRGGQQIIKVNKAIFAVLRTSPDGDIHTLNLTNVSDQSVDLAIDLSSLPLMAADSLTDLLSGQRVAVVNSKLELTVKPYQVIWLRN